MRLSGHFSHGIAREIKKEAVFVSEISAGILSHIIKKSFFIQSGKGRDINEGRYVILKET